LGRLRAKNKIAQRALLILDGLCYNLTMPQAVGDMQVAAARPLN
jgi:hypothetical protein